MFGDSAPGHEDGWTTVMTSIPTKSSFEPRNQGHLSEALPSLDALPRPERLFESQLPYHMIVRLLDSAMNSGVVVQSSHQPSLELLAGYLTKYTKSMSGVSEKVRKPLLPTSQLPYFPALESITFWHLEKGLWSLILLSVIPVTYSSKAACSASKHLGFSCTIPLLPIDKRAEA